MKDDKRNDLYPPVLPSWGSMLPASPPNGYGNIKFDPDQQLPKGTDEENTKFDVQALGFLSRIFRRRHRPI